jgi:hypothetical protein
MTPRAQAGKGEVTGQCDRDHEIPFARDEVDNGVAREADADHLLLEHPRR